MIDLLVQYCDLQFVNKALTAGVGILEQHFPLLDLWAVTAVPVLKGSAQILCQ